MIEKKIDLDAAVRIAVYFKLTSFFLYHFWWYYIF